MIDKKRLEHEIKALGEAEHICANYGFSLTQSIPCRDKLYANLQALTTPPIKDGTLGRWVNKGTDFNGAITEYDVIYKNPTVTGWTFDPLPIEVILRHLAPEGKVTRWKYVSANSIVFVYEAWGTVLDDNSKEFRIPAPYREDWEGIGGTL